MTAVERLPHYLQSVRAPARRLLERHVADLLSPIAKIESRVQGLLAGVLSAGNDAIGDAQASAETLGLQVAALGLVGTFISAADFDRLDAVTSKNLLLVYPYYVEARGTREGVNVLVRLFVPEHAFSVAERAYPRPAVRVGETRLAENGRALHTEDAEARSLILTIAAEPEDVPYADVLRRVLKTEIPVGLEPFIVFAPQRPPRPIDPRSWPTTGDRL